MLLKEKYIKKKNINFQRSWISVYIMGICDDRDGEEYFPVAEIGDRKQIWGGAGSREASSVYSPTPLTSLTTKDGEITSSLNCL
jgi:hypothetical protein